MGNEILDFIILALAGWKITEILFMCIGKFFNSIKNEGKKK